MDLGILPVMDLGLVKDVKSCFWRGPDVLDLLKKETGKLETMRYF